MKKGALAADKVTQIQAELDELALLQDYLSKTSQDKEEFDSIARRDEIVILDGGIRIPKILMLKNASGVIQILNRHEKVYDSEEIEQLSSKTGLNRDDIVILMKAGMLPSDISEAAERLPFKEIADSAAIRELIKKNVSPELIDEMRSKGVNITVGENGEIKQDSLRKIAEIDEEGLDFDENWYEKNLRPFAEVGLIDDEKLAAKDVEENGNTSVQVVTFDQKREEQTKEEVQKDNIARALNIDSDEIVGIIRIEDREGGSKLFNHDMTDEQKPVIVRLRNDKYKVLSEAENGELQEMLGYEATPASRQVSALLKDFEGNSAIKANEIRAGKTNPNQSEYNVFQIRRAGENTYDDSNNLLFVGSSGKTDMSFIESRDNGEVRFARPPVSSVYPSSIYMEDNTGTTQKKEITTVKDEKDNSINLNDLAERERYLEEELEKEKAKKRDRDAEEEEEDYRPGTRKRD